jgi:polygalacturonase
MNTQRRIVGLLAFLLGAAGAGAATYNVRDYGAKADQTTNDAPAIQAAIDACTQAGGGDVIVPAGNYRVGSIALKSHVALILQSGCILWASPRWEDYKPEIDRRGGPSRNTWLITADGQDDVTLAGTGEIHGLGEGELDRRPHPGPELVRHLPHRFNTMKFSGCQDLHIRDITVRYSERYTIYLSRCERVFIDGVTILNNFWRNETDGIDPSSCKDIFISNCTIVAGDDCICPKTSDGIPVENMVVTNCILQSVATAIKLGTTTDGDFRDIKVSNCVIRNSGVGIGFFINDGGTAEGLSFDNISIETTTPDTEITPELRNSSIPIYIDIEQRNPEKSRIGAVRDVSFSNIQVTSDTGILLQGMTQSPIRNLTLRNITFRVPQAFDFSHRMKRFGGNGNLNDDRITKYVRQPAYLSLANIDGLDVDDVRVLIDPDVAAKFNRSALSVFDSRDGVIRDVERRPTGTGASRPAVTVTDCQDVRVIPTDAAPAPGP